jgi:hypothetical protein
VKKCRRLSTTATLPLRTKFDNGNAKLETILSTKNANLEYVVMVSSYLSVMELGNVIREACFAIFGVAKLTCILDVWIIYANGALISCF